MIEDADLLRRYANDHSEPAFAELVQRRVNLVYSVALRQTGNDVHLAQDVTQRVFTDLARKAKQLTTHTALSGWLHRSTQLAAIEIVRAERRRRVREQEAHLMNEDAPADAPIVGEKIRPLLDQVLSELDEDDRNALALRFFEEWSFAEIGAAFRFTEDAARKRVNRALDKLHGRLARRGVTSTTAALGLALAGQGTIAAPAGLAASVSGAAVAGAVGGGSVFAALGIVLTMSKIKTGIVIAVVMAGLTTAIVEVRANRELRAELGAARNAMEALPRLQRESRELNAALTKIGAANPEVAELARLNARVAQLKARPAGVADALMKPATAWTNAGRATPEAIMETFCWALYRGDLETVAGLIRFTDDTPENRAAFMANFSEAVRARYRTPERMCAAGLFWIIPQHDQFHADDAFQILSAEPDEKRPGQVNVRAWFRAAGKESEGGDRYMQTPDGWAIAGLSLTNENMCMVLQARFDWATGDVRQPVKKLR